MLRAFGNILVCVFIVIVSLCSVSFAGPYVAFSLREAASRSQMGQKTEELLNLAGMTRIVGMVHEPNEDIILIGRMLDGQVGASLDDLVVALRARLIQNQWPTVSIDPTKDTLKTGLQKVTFLGGISGTQFGKDFLNSDIFLKKYSLEEHQSADPVKSYRFVCVDDIKANLEAKGVRVIQTWWLQAKDSKNSVQKFHGRYVKSKEFYQTRFWFTPMEPYRFVAREGVFCIRELRLGVKKELIIPDTSSKHQKNATGTREKAAELFAKNFTQYFPKMAANEASVNRLKILYDLVAVAEGILNLDHRPDLSYFLKEYTVSPCETRQHYELMEIVGFVERADGLRHIIAISGGVTFKTAVKWLNYGDVTPLRDVVLNTRPSPTTLSWTLPLDGWQMPNSQDLDLQKDSQLTAQHQHSRVKDSGCMVCTQSFVLWPPGHKQSSSQMRFLGFFPPSPPAPSLPAVVPRIEYFKNLSGVSMNINVKEKYFMKDSSGELEKISKDVLKSRPKADSLTWPVDE